MRIFREFSLAGDGTSAQLGSWSKITPSATDTFISRRCAGLSAGRPTRKESHHDHADRRAVLEADLLTLLCEVDRGDATGWVVPTEYLETVIVR